MYVLGVQTYYLFINLLTTNSHGSSDLTYSIFFEWVLSEKMKLAVANYLNGHIFNGPVGFRERSQKDHGMS